MEFIFGLLRRGVIWLDFLVFTLIVYLLAWLPWRGKHPVSRLFHAWCRTFVRAMDVDLRLHQKNMRPLPDRFILIANHPSAFEDIGIPALFDVVSLAKLQVKDWWIVGRISRAGGTLYVDRDDPESRKSAVGAMVDAVNFGQNIALYPEGGCKGRRVHADFKSGAFEVSIQTGIPLLPVFLHYEAQDDFEWQPPYTLPQKLWHMLNSVNRRANYYVFDVIDPREFASKAEMKAAVQEKYLSWDRKYLE